LAGNKARYKRDLKKNGDDFGAPAWMTTYSDMVTLLLTFFVLLYSFSAIDLQRFQEVMSAIQHSFLGRTGILSGTMEEIGAEEGQRLDVADFMGQETEQALGVREQELLEMMAQLEETYEKVRVFLQEAGLEEDIALRMEERGIVMELPEKILFDTGRAEIKPEFLPTLDLLARLIAGLRNQIIVEGHTDNIPIKTFLYPSNWELSVARSVSVARCLVERYDLEPDRFLVTGYGEYHPIASNDTPEGRARNRRVTLVISIKQLEE
jgi:chemotaxis protein MotB